MRHLLYREHKYVSAAFNDLERMIAKADFTDPKAIEEVSESFEGLMGMQLGHASHEDKHFHSRLKNKGSDLYAKAQEDHDHLDQVINQIRSQIEGVRSASTEDEKVEKGYHLYLTFRKFVGDNLIHLHEEETQILPELQRLYSDEELRAIESETYEIMTPDQMVEMMEVLFPHMNRQDKLAFLTDIQALQPQKFIQVWEKMNSLLSESEKEQIEKKLLAV